MQKTISMQCVAGPAILQRSSALPQRAAFRPAAVRRAAPARSVQVFASAAPPTVADAKAAFMTNFTKPLPTIYSTVIFELLVQQHIFRWNKNYSYSEVAALGVCSIFDQVLEGMPSAERDDVFNAYITALQEDPARYRADAKKMEDWAKSVSSSSELTPSADGGDGARALAAIAEKVKSKNFLYTKFFAVGLFRMLELAPGGKDPKALTSLVSALGIEQERVNADLMTYKGVLSKLQAAKEIMKEFMEREKKKAAERLAAKQAKEAGTAAAAAASTEGGDGPQPIGA